MNSAEDIIFRSKKAVDELINGLKDFLIRHRTVQSAPSTEADEATPIWRAV
jgi:hypothetical protein